MWWRLDSHWREDDRRKAEGERRKAGKKPSAYNGDGLFSRFGKMYQGVKGGNTEYGIIVQ